MSTLDKIPRHPVRMTYAESDAFVFRVCAVLILTAALVWFFAEAWRRR